MLKKGIISAFILFVTLGAIAQNGIIKGTVKDKLTNEPIIGANILIVGTSSGTATDFDGNFVSLRTIGVSEIKRNPGGNRDISRVIQSLPGVTSTGSFRNDLIIRGGAPNENRFFIHDVEVPVINHFATQGSSGGPAGIINVDFVREVDFFSGAFPVNRGNTLSSVFSFCLKPLGYHFYPLTLTLMLNTNIKLTTKMKSLL